MRKALRLNKQKHSAGKCPECGSLIIRGKPTKGAICEHCYRNRNKAVEVILEPAEKFKGVICTFQISKPIYEELYAVATGQKPKIGMNQLVESLLLMGIARLKGVKWVEATFAERAAKGEKAEQIVKKWLEKKGCIVYMFPHPQKLTESEIPTELKMAFKNWPQPPDGIARTPQGEVFFFDVKFKSKPLFIVNCSDYDRYFALSKVLPVKVFFYVDGKPPQLYVHEVTEPSNFNIALAWDRNEVYLIPERLAKKIEDFEIEAEF